MTNRNLEIWFYKDGDFIFDCRTGYHNQITRDKAVGTDSFAAFRSSAEHYGYAIDISDTMNNVFEIRDLSADGTVYTVRHGITSRYPIFQYEIPGLRNEELFVEMVKRLVQVVQLAEYPSGFGIWDERYGANQQVWQLDWDRDTGSYTGRYREMFEESNTKPQLVEQSIEMVNELIATERQMAYNTGYNEGYDAGRFDESYVTPPHVEYRLYMCFSETEKQLITSHEDPLWLLQRLLNIRTLIHNDMNAGIRFAIERVVNGELGNAVEFTDTEALFLGRKDS
jgi:hypothetical protein